MTDPDKAPMTIKAVPTATRTKMVRCAEKRGQTMAVWLARAVDNQANLEAGDQVEPALFEPREVGLPLVKPEPISGKPFVLADLRDAMAAAAAVATASGLPLPKVMARHAYALLTAQLREARGLSPAKPRQTLIAGGQTRIKSGQTTLNPEQ